MSWRPPAAQSQGACAAPPPSALARNLSLRMSPRRLAWSLVLLGGMLLIAGCGGSGSKSSHRDGVNASMPANAAVARKLITMVDDDAILAAPTTALPVV